MEKNTYLKDTLKVSRLGFGAWRLGNTAHGREMSIEEGVSLVNEALEKGINFFDTAPNYAYGRSETILGIALEGKRDKVVINSKFGHFADGTIDFSESKIRISVEESLKRLKTDYLDSLILHNPSFEVLEGKTRHFDELRALKEEGIIKGYGVSVDTPEEVKTVMRSEDIDVMELYFNIFAQASRELLDAIKERDIALIIKVPLDSGWLTGKYTKDTNFTNIKSRWSDEDKARRVSLVEKLKELSDGPIKETAIRFILSYDAVTTVIPGIRTKSHLEDHVHASEKPLDETLKKQLEAFYDELIKGDPLPW